MKVDVYRNLNKGGLSIRSREQEDYGQVIQHVEEAIVTNPKFVVQPSGRQRVLDEGRKNVHAFVRGILSDRTDEPPASAINVNYYPYHRSEFVDTSTGKPIEEGEIAWVNEDVVKVIL